MLFSSAIAGALLAATASAGEVRVMGLQHKYQVRAADVLERGYDDLVAANAAARHPSERRSSPSVVHAVEGLSGMKAMNATTVAASTPAALNLTAWNQQTSAACSAALSRLDVASNPSGTCICYNLPSLDTTTGVFEADLRLFKISDPTGAFAGIPPQNIEVGLSYASASVSPVSASRMSTRDVTPLVARAPTGNLELLQAYLFVGQIDKTKITSNTTMAQFEALVMPVLTLTGKNAAGNTVSTNVSSNEAAFVAGVFSNQMVMSDFAVAQSAVSLVVSQLQNGTVAFVLPGVQILIFPVGLVITSVWLVLGLIAYGYGTYQRIGYAESFKRRSAIAGNTKRTI